jgi:hypothetical protein
MSSAFELLVHLRSNSARRSAWLRVAQGPACDHVSRPESVTARTLPSHREIHSARPSSVYLDAVRSNTAGPLI